MKAIPVVVTAVAALGLGGFLIWQQATRPAITALPDLVTVAPGDYTVRPPGTWRQAGREVDPPLVHETATDPLAIMRHQVSGADYALCVAAGACLPASASGPDMPQTGVSWHDATAYAHWFSKATGQRWRLPTDAEWQRAAAERFIDDAAGPDGSDPAQRWLAAYARNVAARGEADLALRSLGGWGANSLGLSDMGGNVWEWTDSCVINGTIGADGTIGKADEFCGARVAEGRHRAEIIDFVRDARVGGCGAGVPPDYLGFRLVRAG
jgi:formylglycine-generating enzyme required for sulfatase activity